MKIDWDILSVSLQSAGFVEDGLRLPSGFARGTLEENDWTFVIKLHAFFESLLILSISRNLMGSHPFGLVEVVARLDTADSQKGKIAIAHGLDLFEKDDRVFLEKLAGLRNKLAHTIEHIGFDFAGYVSLMDANQRKAFVKGFTTSGTADAQMYIFGSPISSSLALEHPKEFLFCGALDLIHLLECGTPHPEIKKAEAVFGKQVVRAFWDELFGPSSTEAHEE